MVQLRVEEAATRAWLEGGRLHELVEPCRLELGVPCFGARRTRRRAHGRCWFAADAAGSPLAAVETSGDRLAGFVARLDLDTEVLAQAFRLLCAESAAAVAEVRTDDSIALPLVLGVPRWKRLAAV